MNQGELMNCGIYIVIGFLLYSFIQNGLCKKYLIEGLTPCEYMRENTGNPCRTDYDCQASRGQGLYRTPGHCERGVWKTINGEQGRCNNTELDCYDR